MTVNVVLNTRSLDKSIRGMIGYLRRRGVFHRKAALHMRNYTRRTITMQGRRRPYKPLSRWQRAKTGRRKALLWAKPLIRSRGDQSAGVVFEAPTGGPYNIDQFHRGFTSKAVRNKRMVVPAKGGGILAAFSSRKKSKIPAREVWPTRREAKKELQPLLRRWIVQGTKAKWR